MNMVKPPQKQVSSRIHKAGVCISNYWLGIKEHSMWPAV